jgi:hypothetical protein
MGEAKQVLGRLCRGERSHDDHYLPCEGRRPACLVWAAVDVRVGITNAGCALDAWMTSTKAMGHQDAPYC